MDPAAFSSWESVADLGVNDFEDVVFDLHPMARDVAAGFRAAGALEARLTGSGSALFALFGQAEEAKAAATAMQAAFPDFRFVPARTLAAGPWSQPWIPSAQ